MGSYFVELRVFSWEADTDAPYELPTGLISARALQFENLANATAVFDDALRSIDGAAEKGIHRLTERVKPGRKAAS